MEERIIVGVDGSDGARAALRWALETATVDGSSVEAVAAWTLPVTPISPWAPVPPFDEGDLHHSFESELRSTIEAVRATVPDAPPVALHVVTGFAGPTLVDAARSAGCLAIGRRGHGGFVGLLLGSVADHCLHHATVPLALVPPAGPPADGPVVVGVDDSPHAAAALRWASDAATRLHRPLVAVHAWTWLDQPGHFDPGFDEEAAKAYTANIVARTLGERQVGIVAVNDTPARALLERSARGDLVVVGSRGSGALRSALLGSVSRQLAHHAPSTIVIIRPSPTIGE